MVKSAMHQELLGEKWSGRNVRSSAVQLFSFQVGRQFSVYLYLGVIA